MRVVWSPPLLTLLPGPLYPGVVVPVRVLFMCQTDLFVIYTYSCVKKKEKKKLPKICKFGRTMNVQILDNITMILIYSETSPNIQIPVLPL